MADFTSTRRGIIGAMALAPVVLTMPAEGLRASPLTAWGHAMMQWEQARSAAETASAQYKYATEVERKLWYHEVDAYSDREGEAEERLMRLPAPDHPALLWKLERAMVPEGDALMAVNLEYLAQTFADMRRLLA